MPTYLTDDAICLRVTDFSETSQIVGLFTRNHGLLPLIAKGAKRTSKKNTMSGPLDLLTAGQAVFIAAKGVAELGTLAGWDLVDPRTQLRGDLVALNAAMLAAELTTLLVHPHDPHPDLFAELEAMMQLLGQAKSTGAEQGGGGGESHAPRAIVAYAKSALALAGYGAQFAACLVCGKPVTADTPLRFSTRAGGVLCSLAATEKNCAVDGPTLTIPARIAIALDRLPTPSTLLAAPPLTPARPADPAALLTAMELLLAQVESITNKPIRTRYLLPSIFSTRLRPDLPT